jgi:hypothetical protein
VKVENGDLLADFHNNFNRSRNYFSWLMIVHRARKVRQIETHTTEPSEPDTSPFEFEIAIAMLKVYKLPGSKYLPAELIQAGSEI